MSAVGRQRVWHVAAGDALALLHRLDDDSRTLPVVIVSPAGNTGLPRVPVELLHGRFDGLIAVLDDMAAARALCDAGGEGLATFGGAVRVIPPGGRRGSRSYRTYEGEDPVKTADLVCAHALRLQPPPEIQAAASATPATVAARHRDVRAGRPTTPVNAAQPAEPAPTPGTGGQSESSSELERAVAAEKRLAELEVVAAAATQRFRAEKQRRREAEHAARRPNWPPAVVHADAEEQLRWEINHLWLLTVPEADRRDQALREFRCGPMFVASLDAQVVDRRKALEVVVDVLTRKVWERRVCHQVRTHEHGGRPVVRDGDTAWRAYIRSHTPGAARLLYFECTDGSVEFLAAAHHDDWRSLAGLVS